MMNCRINEVQPFKDNFKKIKEFPPPPPKKKNAEKYENFKREDRGKTITCPGAHDK